MIESHSFQNTRSAAVSSRTLITSARSATLAIAQKVSVITDAQPLTKSDREIKVRRIVFRPRLVGLVGLVGD